MTFIYSIKTAAGVMPVFDSDLNFDGTIPEGNYVLAREVSAEAQASGRALVLAPISSSPEILGTARLRAEDLEPHIGRISITRDGTPIILAKPIDRSQIPANATIVEIPASSIDPRYAPGTIMVIVLVAIIVAIAVGVAIAAWSKPNYYDSYGDYLKSQSEYWDNLFKANEKVSDTETDINGDGIVDIRILEYANGDVYQIQVSDHGVEVYGKDPILIRTGFIPPSPPEPPSPITGWELAVAIVGVAIAVTVVAYVIIKRPKKEKKGG